LSAAGGQGYRAWGLAFALLGVLAFSFRPILIKLAYSAHPISPNTLLFLRMVISLPFFLATAWWLRGSARLTPRDWAAVAGLGFLGYYLASFLDFLGLQYIGAGVGRLILFLYPTLVLVLSFAFLHRKPTPRQLTALGLTYAGVALVVSDQVGTTPEGKLFLFGVLLTFASALFYAAYLVASSQIVQRVGSMRFTAYSMIVATVPAVLQFVALEGASSLELPTDVWLYAVLIGTFATVLPVFLQAEALRRIGATEFALVGAVSPVSVALMSAVGLGEPFGARQAAGAALIIGGVLLVSLKRS
jgi:drug/metabolite transporter (DMT)-like permease